MLQKVLFDVEITIDEVSTHYEVWRTIGTANRAKYSSVFSNDDYSWFLEATMISNQMAMFIALGRLFDSDTRASCFKSLKRELTNNEHLNLVKSIENTLSPYNEVVKKILEIRTLLVAHTETKYTDSEIFSKNDITPDQLGELIDKCKRAIIKVSFDLNIHNRSFKTNVLSVSTKSVLDKLNV